MELIKPNCDMGKGFFAIGIENPKTEENIGTLIRSAKQFGASFVFTIGNRYKKQISAVKLDEKLPILNFKDVVDFKKCVGDDIHISLIELTDEAISLQKFIHPKNCIYILGSEDNGISKELLDLANTSIIIEGNYSLNVAVAGSIVMYNRYNYFTRENIKTSKENNK